MLANCFDSCSPRRPFEANTSEVAAGNNFGPIGMHSRAAMEVASAHRPRGQGDLIERGTPESDIQKTTIFNLKQIQPKKTTIFNIKLLYSTLN